MDERLKKIIDGSDNIVFFGGAGVSTESNIPDFRSEKGLYKAKTEYGRSPEEMISHSFFVNHTETFFDYYKKNLIYPDAKPNKAHRALAKLEAQGKLKAVVTQNIDGLHQMAGNKKVYELHGSVLRNHCPSCGKAYGLDYVAENKDNDGVARCSCGGVIKPDVVLYGESLDDDVISRTLWHLENADMLIIGGTSLTVYPAAGFIRAFTGRHLVLINRDPTPNDSMADLVINDSIGKVLGRIRV